MVHREPLFVQINVIKMQFSVIKVKITKISGVINVIKNVIKNINFDNTIKAVKSMV